MFHQEMHIQLRDRKPIDVPTLILNASEKSDIIIFDTRIQFGDGSDCLIIGH